MNHNYSIIYNSALGEYQVASEKTKTRRSKARKLTATVLMGLLLSPALAQAPIEIIDNGGAVDAKLSDKWTDYDFQTTTTKNSFLDQWFKELGDYMKDSNPDPEKKNGKNCRMT